jgi:hypothetical protein
MGSDAAPASRIDPDAAARTRQIGLMEGSDKPATSRDSSLATMTTQGGSTRYDVSAALSIPNESASMVMVVDRPLRGEIVYVFAPADAPAFASNHPFRAVRFENRTEGTLEGGPVSMFSEDAFLGQALTETLAPGASAVLPFAIERAIEITNESHAEDVNGPLTRGADGAPTVKFEHMTRTVYRMRNDLDQAAKVIVKHARTPNTRLNGPPEGTQENAAANVALMPLTIGAHASTELTVDEREPLGAAVDWLTPAADGTVKAYLADAKSDGSTVAKLTAAWGIRGEIAKLADERSSLRMKAYDLPGSNTAAKAAFERQIKVLDTKIAELTATFEKAMREVTMK